jgi:Fibronectin type III domain.
VGVDNVIVYDRSATPAVELPVVVTDEASDITDASATLHGTITNFGNQTITSRGFEWKLTNGGTYAQVLDVGTGSNMTYALSGLTDSISYTYRAFVSTTDTTVYGAEVQFITLAAVVVIPCEMPTNLQVSNVTSTSAEVSWTAGGEEDTWTVEHKLQGTSEWQVQTVNTMQVTLTDLTPGSTYMVRVKSVCDNEESSYVTTSFVTTVGICNVNYEQYIQLMPNPADDHIDLRINNNVDVKEAVIYNAFGQMVQTVVLTDNYARIDLSSMASGMYFVRVRYEQGVITKKFIKR